MALLYIRQGDVLLVRLPRLPRSARRRREAVLAVPGENGHRHLLKGAQLFEHDGRALAVVPEGRTALLEHDEHPHVAVPEGVWEIRLPRTYDWPTEPRRPWLERPRLDAAPVRGRGVVRGPAEPEGAREERARPYLD